MIYYEVGSCWTWRLHTSPFYFSSFKKEKILHSYYWNPYISKCKEKKAFKGTYLFLENCTNHIFILRRNKRATRLIFYINWRGVCVCGSFSELLNVELWTGFTIKRSKIKTYKTPVPKLKQEWDSLTQALLLAQKHLQQITRIELSRMNVWEVSRRKSPN